MSRARRSRPGRGRRPAVLVRAALVLAAVVSSATGLLAPASASAQAGAHAPVPPSGQTNQADAVNGEPTARLQTTESAGGTVTDDIRLEGWRPGSSVTVSICGNAARRGSQDCDLIGAKGVAIPPGGAVSLAMRLQPPVPCPCVIRVVAANNDPLGTFPIDLPGLPSAPLEGGGAAASGPAGLVVAARLTDDGASLGDRVASWFGISATRRLVLVVSPQGTTPAGPLSGTATLRQGPTTLQTVAVPSSDDARQVDTVEVPITIPALVAGEYTVSGQLATVTGTSRFEATTTNVPWGLVGAAVGAVVLVLVLVWRAGRRHGAREAQRRAATAAGPPAARPPAADPSPSPSAVAPVAPREGGAEPPAPPAPADEADEPVPVGAAPAVPPPGARRVARRPDERRRRERRANTG